MSAMDAAAKWVVASYAIIQLIFFDSIFGMIPLFWKLRGEGISSLKSKRWFLLVFRGALTLCTLFFFFTSLRHMPLADTTIVFLTAPILMIIFSAIFLGESITSRQVFASILGFAGALLVFWPADFQLELTSLLPLLAALTASLGLVLSKVLVKTESPSAISVYELLVTFCVSSIFLLHNWRTPTASDWPIIALIGIMGGLCVYYRTKACKYAPLSDLAPFEYTGILWAILLGFLFWGEIPVIRTLIGAALVMGAGFYALRVRDPHTGDASP